MVIAPASAITPDALYILPFVLDDDHLLTGKKAVGHIR